VSASAPQPRPGGCSGRASCALRQHAAGLEAIDRPPRTTQVTFRLRQIRRRSDDGSTAGSHDAAELAVCSCPLFAQSTCVALGPRVREEAAGSCMAPTVWSVRARAGTLPSTLWSAISSRGRLVADRFTIPDIALYAYTHVADEGDLEPTSYPAIHIRLTAWSKCLDMFRSARNQIAARPPSRGRIRL